MKESYLVCDICGKTTSIENKNSIEQIYAKIDRKMDGSGSMEDEYFSCDICLKCAIKLIHNIVTELRPSVYPGAILAAIIYERG